MSTYVTSDIHGCFDQFMEMLDRIGFTDNDRLYIVGDIIDRGPKSAEMVDWLMNTADSNVSLLLGNHEDMMLHDCPDPSSMRLRFGSDWAYNGGLDTADQMRERLDERTRCDFFDYCRDGVKVHETVTYTDADGDKREVLLVHAGLFPSKQARKAETADEMTIGQSSFDMVWVRDAWLFTDWEPPVPVIFGHTPTPLVASESLRYVNVSDEKLARKRNRRIPIDQARAGADARVMEWGNKTDIDCGCVYGGHLSCIRLEDWKVFYVDSPHERRMMTPEQYDETLRFLQEE